jgi:hypothetical protein
MSMKLVHNIEAPLAVFKEVGLEVIPVKTKCIFISHHQTIRQDHYIMVANKQYLGTMLTNQNFIHEEIRSRLTLGNASYHGVQNLLSSCMLSKGLKIKIS